MQFMTKPKLAVDIHISYKADIINNTSSTNFLGLTLDSTLSRKTHIEQLSFKLNSACYLIRSLRSIISTKNLRTIYFSYVHSIMTYGIIFWSSSPYSDNIFKLHKRTIRIMMNVGYRVSCCELFKKLNILPYIHNIYYHYCL
jgi:predicted membrane protein